MITAIMIDSREPTWIQELKFDGIPTIVTALDSGDCLAACDDNTVLLIERKTPDDLLNTLKEDRLFPQMNAMMDVTRWSYLMITDQIGRGTNGNAVTGRGQTGWQYSAIQGALLTVQELGIFVIYSSGELDYEKAIIRLGNREHNPNLLIAPPKVGNVLSAKEMVIASLPGIGVERMAKVLDYCGSPAWALVALTDPTSKIPGIPSNVKTKVRSALGLKDDQQLVINTDGDTDTELIKVGSLGEQ